MSGTSSKNFPGGSDAAFRALFEQEVVGVGLADVSGRIVSANQRLCDMLGYSQGELLTLTVDDITHPESRAESQRKVEFLLQGGGSYVVEKAYTRADGAVMWGVTNVTAVRDDRGEVLSLLAFVLDVTEQRRAQRSAAFLTELTSRLVSAREEKEIVRTTLESLSQFLKAHRVYFAECNIAENRVVVSEHWPGDPAASFSGSFSLERLGGAAWWNTYSRGDVMVSDALGEEPLPAELSGMGVRSYAVQAMEREHGWRVTLAVTDELPRSWRPDELSLLTDVLARIWPLVERARIEAALSAELSAVEDLLVERHQSDAKRRATAELVTRITADSDRRRRLYETILSNTPDQIYVFDVHKRFTYANAALLDTWGRSWSEVIGKTCFDIGYPDWQAAMHDAELEQVVRSKQSLRGEVPFKATQGERIHDYIFVPVLSAEGEIEAIAGTTRDVTELKQAEYLMAGQAAVLELMVKGAPLTQVLEALCDVVDQQATERRNACILLTQEDGVNLRPVAGRHLPVEWLSSVDPWPIGPESGSCGTAAYRREPVVVLDVLRDPLWVGLKERAAKFGFRSCWSTPIFSTEGAVLGTFALYYQRVHHPNPIEVRLVEIVTRTAGIAIERQRAEEGLKTHTERQRLLWEAAAVMLMTEEPEAMMRGSFLRIAAHFDIDVYLHHLPEEGEDGLRLLSSAGISEPDLAPFSRISPGDELCGDVDQTREPLVVSFIQNTHDEAYPLLRTLGLRAYVCLPMLVEGRLRGTLAFGSRRRDQFGQDEIEFLRTVASYVTVAYERLRLVRELRDADRKKDDFIALLAHELRNPLAPLRNGLHVMQLASHDSAAVGRARAIMERQLSHMVRLIDDLLDVSRITLNKLELRRKHVPLADIVANAVETARPAVDGAEHQLEVSLPAEPVLLNVDLTRLSQVLANLLTNAAKYTPKRGRIAVRARVESGWVVIAVEDNGIGLHPQSLRSIFGMFSQVDHSVERSTGGLGIGLALVKGLTEMHGGTVHAESAGPGLGSRFEVRLPIVIELAEEAAQASGGSASRRAPQRRLLVVDDNRDAVESMATMLRLSGNEVHTAYDGIEAVEKAEALKPDVVLMDIGMPRLNGYDATRRIRAQSWGAGIVVIALTGWGQEADRRQSREAGCNHHLVKPVAFGQLEQLINELCEQTPSREPAASEARGRAS
jgi:PAS domain S-box-containing protein